MKFIPESYYFKYFYIMYIKKAETKGKTKKYQIYP